MNYLLSSSSNVMRDIYQGMINPNADPTKMVALQKVFIVVMGFCAFLMIFVPTVLKWQISILQYAYFAYTMYGVAVTPALFAALTWKRATWQGGIASIVGGAVATVFFEFVLPAIAPGVMDGGEGRQFVLRGGPLGHPQHLPGGRHLDRLARDREPADAEAVPRGPRAAVPREDEGVAPVSRPGHES